MKAALLTQFGQPLRLTDVAEPVPGPDEVLVRVQTCGIDGTDLKLLDGFGYTPELPFIMGHEPAGVVERVGSNVQTVKPGDRVIAYVFYFCGSCDSCCRGRENLCLNMRGVLGVKGFHGGYAELVSVPARQIVKIPDSLSNENASVLCDAGLTAFHGVERAHLQQGENIVIFGVGGVGSFAVQFAKLAGAHVTAVDATEEKLTHARALGADQAVLSADLQTLTTGKFDKVVDIVGSKETLIAGIHLLKPGGSLVIVGYTPDILPLEGKIIAQRELEIVGSRCGSRRQLDELVALAASGRLRSIVTDRAPFTDVNAALDHLRQRKVLGRMVLNWKT